MKKYYPLGIKVPDEEEMEIFEEERISLEYKTAAVNKAVEYIVYGIKDRDYIHPDYIYIPTTLFRG